MQEKENCIRRKDQGVCAQNQCRGCGWDRNEQLHRKYLLTVNGLTLCQDGLYRLILPPKV